MNDQYRKIRRFCFKSCKGIGDGAYVALGIGDTTPKYWEIFFEKSKERVSSDLSYQFAEESFQEDAADKLEEYANGLSDLNSKNAQEEFFTNTRLIVLGSILLLLPFLGVLFSIMRIEKHLAKK